MYAVDDGEHAKQQTAREVLADASTHRVISTQVLIEFYSASTRKLGIAPDVAARMVDDLSLLEVVPASADLVIRAVALSRTHQLTIWDALVVEAAATSDCTELLTEDLAGGGTIRGVRIVNPFTSSR